MDLADAQVGGDEMLRYPPDDVRTFFQQVLITLLRRVADKGNELVDVMGLTPGEHL